MNIKKIIREEVNEWDWVREIGYGIDFIINRAFYFDPTAESGDRDYEKLTELFKSLGFNPKYSTPDTLYHQNAVGLYAYMDNNHNLSYVYTGGGYGEYEDIEEYGEHIKDFASDESITGRNNLEVVDARLFVKTF